MKSKKKHSHKLFMLSLYMIMVVGLSIRSLAEEKSGPSSSSELEVMSAAASSNGKSSASSLNEQPERTSQTIKVDEGFGPLVDSSSLAVVTIVATDGEAAEEGCSPGEFTVSRTGSTSGSLTVFYKGDGSARWDADYALSSGMSSVMIPAGSSGVPVSVIPVDDGIAEAVETVSLFLAPNGAYQLGSPGSATVYIKDNDAPDPSPRPTVTLAASDGKASETGPDEGRFTVSRTGSTSEPLMVYVQVSGTARMGFDYPHLRFLPIPAGQSTLSYRILPIDDSEAEGGETVVFALLPSSAYVVGQPSQATITIADNDHGELPVVTIVATDGEAAEEGRSPGEFTVSRTGSTSSSLTVFFKGDGSARWDADYVLSSGMSSVMIPAGASGVPVSVIPVDDGIAEAVETVSLFLAPNGAYQLGSPGSATVYIKDNDAPDPSPRPTVTLVASDGKASETGPEEGRFTVSRTGSTSEPLMVYVQVSGTARMGFDYPHLRFLPIPAGQSTLSYRILPIDDSEAEGGETVVFALLPSSAYVVGQPSQATITIADNDHGELPVVTIVATDGEAAEEGRSPGEFTVSRTGSTSSSLTVFFKGDGSARWDADYVLSSGMSSVTIPAGASGVPVSVIPVDDGIAEAMETVSLFLAPNGAYQLGSPGSATVFIKDNDGSQAPLSMDDEYRLEKVPLLVGGGGLLLNDSDPNGGSLTSRLVAGPSYGDLQLNPDGSFVYTPHAGFPGMDHFTYVANNGWADSKVASVTLRQSLSDCESLYAIDTDSDSLVSVNLETRQTAEMGSLGIRVTSAGAAFSEDGTLWVFSRNEDDYGQGILYTVDPKSGSARVVRLFDISEIPESFATSFGPDEKTLYWISGSYLGWLDVANGSLPILSTLPLPLANLALQEGSRIFISTALDQRELIGLDPVTGQVGSIGSISLEKELTSLAAAPSGVLYGHAEGSIYELGANGEGESLVLDTGFNLRGLAFPPRFMRTIRLDRDFRRNTRRSREVEGLYGDAGLAFDSPRLPSPGLYHLEIRGKVRGGSPEAGLQITVGQETFFTSLEGKRARWTPPLQLFLGQGQHRIEVKSVGKAAVDLESMRITRSCEPCHLEP